MADTWITNLRHFLNQEGEIAPSKGTPRKLAEHITSIVALASHPDVMPPESYQVRCRRRPGRKPCTGMIEVDLDWETGDIIWYCPICMDMGRISIWRKSKWDLSGDNFEQISDASGPEYDNSWDLAESDEGCLPFNEEAWDKQFAEWTKRQWKLWLNVNLKFPFLAIRVDDEDDAYFNDIAENEHFRLNHTMKVVDVSGEDDLHGIIVKVREGGETGYVPLCDLEVYSKEDHNYWPVREYVVWFANK